MRHWVCAHRGGLLRIGRLEARKGFQPLTTNCGHPAVVAISPNAVVQTAGAEASLSMDSHDLHRLGHHRGVFRGSDRCSWLRSDLGCPDYRTGLAGCAGIGCYERLRGCTPLAFPASVMAVADPISTVQSRRPDADWQTIKTPCGHVRLIDQRGLPDGMNIIERMIAQNATARTKPKINC